MDSRITREDWEQHVLEDDRRGEDINELKMAMFGNPDVPDSVKQAVMPTMTRLNTYLDGIAKLGRFTVGLVVLIGAATGFAKTVGWM